MSAENIEKGVPFFSVQAANRRNVGIIGVQFLDQHASGAGNRVANSISRDRVFIESDPG